MVRLVHRPRLNTNYVEVVKQIGAVMEDLPPMPKKPILALDATGLGAPVADMAKRAGLKPLSIVITAGNSATLTGLKWSVPKALLVGELRATMHQKRIKVAQGFRDREVLAEELANFTARVSPSGRATFEAAGDRNDDALLSLALAVFASKHRPQPVLTIRNSTFLAR